MATYELALKSALDAKNGKITITDDSTALTDSDGLVQTSAGASPTSMKRRSLSLLWNYIKGKISSVLGLTETTMSSKTMTGSLSFPNDKQIYFGSADDMAIGIGTPPAYFTRTIENDNLVTGAYMVYGASETGGIIVGGDGIDVWAPPDRDLIRFWNEDDGYPVASIDRNGRYMGKTWMADRKSIYGAYNSFLGFDSDINNAISWVKGSTFGPGIYDFENKQSYNGFDRTDFIAAGSDGPDSSYLTWFVDTKIYKYASTVYGIQIAWAATTNNGRTNYKRYYNGSSWSSWSSNDL